MKTLTHVDENGAARMVDVGDKDITSRTATASAAITMNPSTLEMITINAHKKGDVLNVARIAGIQAAKQTASLIPLCHNINLSVVNVDFDIDIEKSTVFIYCVCKLDAKTGVEMEAMTAASVTALTIYDMCKGVDREMLIHSIRVLEKKGGKSGHWKYQKRSMDI